MKMQADTFDKHLNPWSFWPATIALGLFILAGVFDQEQLGAFLNGLLYSLANNLGWYINLLSLSMIFLVLVFIIYRYGDIKIGGADAKPQYSTFNWCCMTIAGSLGTGILFWAMGEPIFHFATPPVAAGVTPFSRQAAIYAISQAMWDWSFIQYAMYGICAVGFAIVTYNLKKSLSFGSLLEVIFGRPMPKLTILVHALIIFCLCGAVSNSMGVGVMQVGAGIELLLGIPQSKLVWLIISVCICSIFTISCVCGMARGLQRLATLKIFIFMSILVFVILLGDTQFMSKLGTEATGYMIDHWGMHTTIMNSLVPEDHWFADWIIQYWCSFFVYAPVIGMFFSRMAKGHTVRKFLMVSVVVPSVFCMFWIGIFGSMTIKLQTSGILDIWSAVHTYGMQTTIFQILSSLPFGTIFMAAFIVSTCISFCCLADPMAAVLATLSVRNLQIDDEAPKLIKIIMGLLITTVAYVLVASGGVNSVKGMFVLIGVPVSFVVIACIYASFKLCEKCIREKNYGCLEEAKPAETREETRETPVE